MSRIELDTPIGTVSADLDELSADLSYLLNKVKKIDKVDQAINEFLMPAEDTANHAIESKRKYYHNRSYIFWMEAMMGIIEENYTIIRSENYNYGDNMTAPVWFDEKIGDTTIKVPHKLVMFVESKTNVEERCVIMFTPFDEYEVDMVFQFRSGTFDYSSFWEKVENYFYTKGMLKGAHFSADFKMLDTETLTWDSMIIKDDDRKILERNLIKFIDSVELFQQKGLRGSRGVLLAGPPGTGKTLTCKVLMNEIDATVLYVARDAVTDVGQITELYKMARRFAPAIVILEDIDTLGGLGRDEADHPLLGEFLNCLAGVEENGGVVTLATTNHPEKLDWALTDRPGRFDVRLKFDYPDEETRLAILEKYLQPFTTKGINLKSITRGTEKFSGAYLHELVQSAFMFALEECDYCKNPTIAQSHLTAALERLENQRATVSKEKGLSYSGDELTFEELYN
jgi:AAA+ superfamily predicted ATPase